MISAAAMNRRLGDALRGVSQIMLAWESRDSWDAHARLPTTGLARVGPLRDFLAVCSESWLYAENQTYAASFGVFREQRPNVLAETIGLSRDAAAFVSRRTVMAACAAMEELSRTGPRG